MEIITILIVTACIIQLAIIIGMIISSIGETNDRYKFKKRTIRLMLIPFGWVKILYNEYKKLPE